MLNWVLMTRETGSFSRDIIKAALQETHLYLRLQSRYCYSVALRLYGGLRLDFSLLLDGDLKHVHLVCVCLYMSFFGRLFSWCVCEHLILSQVFSGFWCIPTLCYIYSNRCRLACNNFSFWSLLCAHLLSKPLFVCLFGTALVVLVQPQFSHISGCISFLNWFTHSMLVPNL